MALVKRKSTFVEIKDLKVGDIIEFERAGGLYFHCAIYIGKGLVIHRAADPRTGSGAAFEIKGLFEILNKESNKAEIRKDDLRLVAGSSDVYRTNMYDDVYTPCPGQEIVKWAEEQIGEKGYNVFLKNCQHFCTMARYGDPVNMQVEKYLGLRTGFSYEKNRSLVNTVKLSDLSLQQVGNISAVEKVWIHSFEGDAGIMVHIYLEDKKGNRLCALTCSSFAIQAFLTTLKHHTYFSVRREDFKGIATRFESSEMSNSSIENSNYNRELLNVLVIVPYHPIPLQLREDDRSSFDSSYSFQSSYDFTNSSNYSYWFGMSSDYGFTDEYSRYGSSNYSYQSTMNSTESFTGMSNCTNTNNECVIS